MKSYKGQQKGKEGFIETYRTEILMEARSEAK
jgi:hypothetical protein